MEMIVAYLAGVVVLQGLFAIRAPHEEALTVYAICLFWPVSIVLIALMFLLGAVKWDFDVAESTKRFGFRKPTNPNAKGFAITLFNTEFQFYSMKKA
jgi:glucan phosphoethanolaminetransferase (alkaline phosphatase superfamily)